MAPAILMVMISITGRWGTDGTLVGGYKADQIYSVENSSKDGTSYIDGNDLSSASSDTLYYNYVSNGRFINGVYVKMDDGQSYSGKTVKGFTGFDSNNVAQGTQGHDVFRRIGTIYGTQGDDLFEGSSAGGHHFDGGGGGNDRFISHGGVGSSYTADTNLTVARAVMIVSLVMVVWVLLIRTVLSITVKRMSFLNIAFQVNITVNSLVTGARLIKTL